MLVTLIAALARDGTIGSASGGIPWDHPRDRRHFRAYTAGKWLLVGRRTYGEMDGWFGDRIPLVLTRDASFRPRSPGHRTVASVGGAIDLAQGNGAGELVVCGGGEVYAHCLPFADRLVLTRIEVDAACDGAVRFPDFASGSAWKRRYRETWPGKARPGEAQLEVYERSRDRPR